MSTFKTLSFIATFFMLVAYNNVTAQCSTPSGLSATVADATSMNLMWTAVAGADDYTINIQNGPDNPVPFDLTITDVATASYLATGLSATTNYKFKVRTHCGGDHSSWSEYFFFYTGIEGGGGSCDAITGLATTDVTATTASFTWDALDAAIKYRIRVEDGSGNPVAFGVTMVSPTNVATITGLTASSNYKFKVRGRCPSGTGSWSDWTDFTTAPLRFGEIANTIAVYPNPASNTITIVTSGGGNLMITDLTGKIMYSMQIDAAVENVIVNITDFPAAMYMVVLQQNNSTKTSTLVVTK